MFAAEFLFMPAWLGAIATGLLVIFLIGSMVALAMRSNRKDMAMRAELTVLKEENARLRDELH